MTNKDRPRAWMPMYWGDYLKDTLHLTPEAHGAYILLIAAYWTSGKQLPAVASHLRAITRLDEQGWERHKDTLQALFQPRDGYWHHKRIESELLKAKEISEKRAKAGKRGGKAKAKAKQLPPQSQSQSLPQSKDSVANATGALAVADDRTNLFNGSLVELGRLAGKEPNKLRPLVGRWLKICNDDAGTLVSAIAAASERRVADPVAWIEAGMRARAGPRNGAQDLSNTNLQIFLRSLATA